jgi:exopolysaccharide/PEP-CTERM locus tyrosine autokinase
VSLVERAVKRLEELGRAHGTTDEGHAAPAGEAVLNDTIERAVGRSRVMGLGQASDRDMPSVTGRARAEVPDRRDGAVDGSNVERIEPKLGGVSLPASPVSDGPGGSSRAPQPSQRVELDFKRLAATGLIDLDKPESAVANEFRRIKRPLILACQGRLAAPVTNANRIMVTSSVQGEGKSFVALNLAFSMAMERDFSVLLVDADTTRRSLSKQLGISGKTGLLDLLDDEQIERAAALLRTNVDGLELLPVGAPRPHATELLASDAMERLVDDLASRYRDRILIFDTPPLLGAPEPAALATHMGQVIVVVEAGKTKRKALGNALAAIESCPLVTTLLNKTTNVEAGYHYYDAASADG